MNNIEIIFDNPSEIVYSGQILTGRVEINTDSTKKIKAISIQFKGEARVKWIQKEKINDNSKQQIKNVAYTGIEEYFNNNLYLLGSATSSAIEIKPGKHKYAFNILIPQTAPSSFDGEKGYVKYNAKVTIDRPWKFDKIINKNFTVISLLDLNFCPWIRNPVALTIEKNYHCCFLKSGQINIRISVPYSGYASGQAVLFNIEIENSSSTSIRDIKFSLFKTVTYHSKIPRQISTQNQEKVTQFKSGRSFGARTNSTFNERFIVPFVPPSHMINCTIIDVNYEIHIKVKFSRPHKKRVVVLPIEIGTVPLANMESTTLSDQNTTIGLNSTQGQQSIGWNPNVSDSSTAFLLPPPSYDETIGNRPSTSLENRDLPNYPGIKLTVSPSAPSDVNIPGPSAPFLPK